MEQKNKNINLAEEKAHFIAFVNSSEDESIIKEAISRLLLPYSNIHKGGIKAAIKTLANIRSPKILLVDITDSELPVSDINALADVCEPGVKVLTMGSKNDVGLFRDLLSIGISDYLTKPLSIDLVQRAIGSLIDTEDAPPQTKSKTGKIITFVGTRGGVGSSTIATKTAWHLGADRKRRTVILDLDLHFGTVGLTLDLDIKHDLREALEHPDRVDSIFIDGALERVENKLFVINSEENLSDEIVFDEDALKRLIARLREQFHFVVIDLPRQVTPAMQLLLNMSDVCAVVTDQTLPGMRDTVRFINHIAVQRKDERLYLISNKTSPECPGWFPLDEFEKNIGRQVSFTVGFDTNIAKSTSYGHITLNPKSPADASIIDIAHELAGWGHEKSNTQKTSLFQKILGK